MTNINFSHFSAVIFDMDGTMIDNAPYHKKAWNKFLETYQITLTEEEFKRKVSGKKNSEILPGIFNKTLTDSEIANYAEEKERMYRELYADDIKEVPGLVQLVNFLKQKGLKTAIATTAPEKNRIFGLKALGLEGKFDIILGDEDVTKGKPDPEIYLETAKRLGVDPAQCIVFEDTPSGIQSAKSAGMTVVAILTSHTTKELKNADYFVKDFTRIVLI